MIRVFDFRCPNAHVTEHFVATCDTGLVTCPECGETATRQPAAPRSKLDPFTGHFPSAADAWEKRRESHMAKERRNVANHDSYK